MKLRSIIIIGIIVIATAVWIYGRQQAKEYSTPSPDSSEKTASSGDTSELLKVVIPDSLPSQIKKYEGFTLSFNRTNHTPNYVAWELLPDETDGVHSRYNKFWQDPEIKGCPTTSDYTRSGFDRGHLCPAADQKWSNTAMEHCFVMANICPQDHSLNSGAWATLEKRERNWANQFQGLIIIAGPIYQSSDTQTIGSTRVRVPSAFFKVMLAHNEANPKAIAAVYPNMAARGNIYNYFMSVDDLEKLTGFNFFSSLPDNVENQIEATFNPKEWK